MNDDWSRGFGKGYGFHDKEEEQLKVRVASLTSAKDVRDVDLYRSTKETRKSPSGFIYCEMYKITTTYNFIEIARN